MTLKDIHKLKKYMCRHWTVHLPIRRWNLNVWFGMTDDITTQLSGRFSVCPYVSDLKDIPWITSHGKCIAPGESVRGKSTNNLIYSMCSECAPSACVQSVYAADRPWNKPPSDSTCMWVWRTYVDSSEPVRGHAAAVWLQDRLPSSLQGGQQQLPHVSAGWLEKLICLSDHSKERGRWSGWREGEREKEGGRETERSYFLDPGWIHFASDVTAWETQTLRFLHSLLIFLPIPSLRCLTLLLYWDPPLISRQKFFPTWNGWICYHLVVEI